MKNYEQRVISDAEILVINGEPEITAFIHDTLDRNGYSVCLANEPKAALREIKSHNFGLAFISAGLESEGNLRLCKHMMARTPRTEMIVIAGASDEKQLDPYLNLGLSHFLFKPFNESQLIYTTYAALHYKRLRNCQEGSRCNDFPDSGLVGNSKSIRTLRTEIAAIADTEIPVLILGASGTGKEIIARDLHLNSRRREKAFIPINCSVLGDLAETELFGHVRGAFTGATVSTTGYIGAADGGTIFFDEVGDLPTGVQAKLLRFLDSGEYSRVGDAAIKQANVRIVAATNRDLETMIQRTMFREDLFYRLSGAIFKTVPLRERRVDILPLIYHFLDQFSRHHGISFEISAEASSMLIQADWPGNVRQLKQTLYKMTQLAPTRSIGHDDVKRVLGMEHDMQMDNYQEAKRKALEEFDREYFTRTLCLADGSLKKALDISGMHKRNFYTKIKQLDLTVKDFTGKKKS